MKRIFAVILAVMLMAGFAIAEPKQVAEYSGNIRLVYSSDIFAIEDRDYYYFAGIDGVALTEAVYTDYDYPTNGYMTVRRYDVTGLNSQGMIDMAGNVMVPFQYGTIKLESEEWAIAYVLSQSTAENYDFDNYSGEYFLIEQVDIYHLPEGKLLAQLPRTNFLSADAINHCLNIEDRGTGVISTYDSDFNCLGVVDSIYDDDFAPADYDTYRDNGQYGIVDKDGNIIMPPSYQYVYIQAERGYAEVSTGTYEGLVRLSDGKLCVPAEYEDVKYTYNHPYDKWTYDTLGYFCVVKDGKVGYVDSNGNVTCEPRYSKDIAEINGVSYTVTDLQGNTLLIAADGAETVLPKYDRLYALNYASGMYYYAVDANGKYGVIDWHGNEVLPFEYTDIDMSGSGKYMVVSKDYNNYIVLEMDYNGLLGTSAQAAPVAETPATDTQATVENTGADVNASIGGGLAGNAGAPAAEEAPATEEIPAAEDAPAVEENTATEEILADNSAPAAADNTAAIGYLNSAIALVNVDATANAAAAKAIIGTAMGSITNTDANGLITSAIMLLNAEDPSANAPAIVALLQSAVEMLK